MMANRFDQLAEQYTSPKGFVSGHDLPPSRYLVGLTVAIPWVTKLGGKSPEMAAKIGQVVVVGRSKVIVSVSGVGTVEMPRGALFYVDRQLEEARELAKRDAKEKAAQARKSSMEG